MTRLLVRADGGPREGTGHVARGLALAHAWIRRGGTVAWMGQIAPGALRARIDAVCGAPPMDPTGLTDVDSRPDWLAIDGYTFSEDLVDMADRLGVRTLRIDDLGPRWSATLTVDPNLAALASDGPLHHRVLRGPGYALLGPAHRPTLDDPLPGDPEHGAPRPATGRVLVTFGGSDPTDATLAVLKGLESWTGDPVTLDVVVGPASRSRDAVVAAAAEHRLPVHLHHAPEHLADLMAGSDAAITALGTTVYELARHRVPMVGVPVVDNQDAVASAVADAGWATLVDPDDLAEGPPLCDALQHALTTPLPAHHLPDGRGADRIVAAMHGLLSACRPVQDTDADVLLEWANDPAARANSFRSDPITPDEHAVWIERLLHDPDQVAHIILDAGDPVAFVRHTRDAATGRWTVSLNVAPAARGTGIAAPALVAAREALLAGRSDVPAVDAYIKPENRASRVVFSIAGFGFRTHTTVHAQDAVRLEWTPGDHHDTP